MGLRDLVLGPRCDMCARRADAVFTVGTLKVCMKCKGTLRRSDRSAPHGSREAGYRPGQPVKLAGPMGGQYRGPAPKPQRRK